jgi:hypothetical protein
MEVFSVIFQKYAKLYSGDFESAVRAVEALVADHPEWLKDSSNFFHHAAWFGIAAAQLECKMATYRPYRKIRAIITSGEPIRFPARDVIKSSMPIQLGYAAFLERYAMLAEKSMGLSDFK